jgi:hypothetical protein
MRNEAGIVGAALAALYAQPSDEPLPPAEFIHLEARD